MYLGGEGGGREKQHQVGFGCLHQYICRQTHKRQGSYLRSENVEAQQKDGQISSDIRRTEVPIHVNEDPALQAEVEGNEDIVSPLCVGKIIESCCQGGK